MARWKTLSSRKGFVWDTTSRANPGNTSPEASDYANVGDDGVLANGTYDVTISELSPDTTYYFRSFGYDDVEDIYIYGSEQSFTTLAENFAIEGKIQIDSTNTEGANVTLLKHEDAAGTAQDSFENEATNDTTNATGDFSFVSLDGDRKYCVLATWTDTGNTYRSLQLPFLVPKDKNKSGA